MKNSFRDSVANQLLAFSRQVLRDAKVGDAEIDVLMLFYDEKNKVRRTKVPKFFLYASICDGKLEDSWVGLMIKVDRALHTLLQVGLIQQATPSDLGAETKRYVDGAADMFELTATGLERLQQIHPNLALQWRGLIAIAPPWLVLAGTVAGGLSALWGMIRLAMTIGLFK